MGVVWPWVAVPHAAAAWEPIARRQAGGRLELADEPTSMRTVLAMGVVFMTLLIAPPSYSPGQRAARGEGPIMVTETPLYLADEVVRRESGGQHRRPDGLGRLPDLEDRRERSSRSSIRTCI